jgi:CspA family cold shock protein
VTTETDIRGTVKFVSDKGFLFLIRDDGGPDVFGHISEWERNGLVEPSQGEKYTFDIVQRPKGPSAMNPRPVL